MLVDIVILPPKSTREKVGNVLKQAVKGLSYFYLVDNRKLIPHLSLLHLRTNTDRLAQLEGTIANIAEKYKTFRVKSTRLAFYPRNPRVLNLFLSKPPIMKRLNAEIVLDCIKFRTGDLFWWKNLHKFGPQDRRYINKYGTYWSVERNFKPHFTLGRMRSEKLAQKAMDRLWNLKVDFLADTIALCTINNNGQVTKILRRFKLK